MNEPLHRQEILFAPIGTAGRLLVREKRFESRIAIP
jgi:hypothetical protein